MNSSGLTVLVIDDSKEDRETYRRYLQGQSAGDYTVFQADSGVEGWELAKAQNPDCLLLDYQLPDFDGLEFIQALNKEMGLNRVAVIMLTGQGDEEVAAQAISLGAQDYLVKGKLTASALQRSIGHAVERAALLRKTEEQRIAIERSQKELEQFAYAVCHDLQSPIRRIISFLDLIQKDTQYYLNEKSQSYLSRTIDNANRMGQLINDTLEFSIIGGERKHPQSVDLGQIVNEILRDQEDVINGQQAEIVIEPMPTIVGYPTMLRRLFQNLLGNALKYRQDENPLTVTISGELEGASWHFRVQDTGIGMDAEALEKIFEPFSRLHDQKEYPGAGIGLATCKKNRGISWGAHLGGISQRDGYCFPLYNVEFGGGLTKA